MQLLKKTAKLFKKLDIYSFIFTKIMKSAKRYAMFTGKPYQRRNSFTSRWSKCNIYKLKLESKKLSFFGQKI